jgi:N,N'-diacetyllegionaminate synthase
MHKKPVLIIAEAGVNHNGDMLTAKKLIDTAAEAGADIVKFQTFKADNLVSKKAPKASYQLKTTQKAESQWEMIHKLELNLKMHHELMKHCAKRKIQFLSTPFDLNSIDLLASLGITLFKIPSGEITNLPYLSKIGKLKKKVIVSTGMANLGEIENAITILSSNGTKLENISLLHCNTEYPTPMRDVNLSAMLTLKNAFHLEVGYSDHTLGIEVPIAAVAMGATIIEKHITLDKKMQGPDHAASLDPTELFAMIKAIRNIEMAMGDGIKKASPSEEKNKVIARKSIHLLKKLPKGHKLKAEDLIMKRPGDGISPLLSGMVVGKQLITTLDEDHKLEFKDLY